jgi:DNA mismatch endonuclease, patch repair protein
MMARVRNRNTAPERVLRRALWAAGLRYRVQPVIEGIRPDLAFMAARIAVFVDGCFWHGCPSHYACPSSSREFWLAKLSKNFHRDGCQTIKLEAAGWRVLRVWEHEVETDVGSVVALVRRAAEEPSVTFGPDWRVIRVDAIDASEEIEVRYMAQLRDPDLHRIVRGPRVTGAGKRRRSKHRASAM